MMGYIYTDENKKNKKKTVILKITINNERLGKSFEKYRIPVPS